LQYLWNGPYLDRSPIAHLEKPPAGRREQVATAEEYRALLSLTRDREFRELLTAAWETGARPQEILHVEARHVDLQNARWVFPPAESKMKRFPRIV
jgi:integrase